MIKLNIRKMIQEEIKNVLTEGFSPEDILTIRNIVKAGKKLIGLSPALKKAGFSSELVGSDMIPYHLKIKKGGSTYILINKSNVDNPDWIEGNIAGGLM